MSFIFRLLFLCGHYGSALYLLSFHFYYQAIFLLLPLGSICASRASFLPNYAVRADIFTKLRPGEQTMTFMLLIFLDLSVYQSRRCNMPESVMDAAVAGIGMWNG